jgi:arylformamidase
LRESQSMTPRDITTPLRTGFPVWPGHAPVGLRIEKSHEAGDGVQITHLDFGAHTATHLDAPRHFVPGGGLVTDLDLRDLIGPCIVLHHSGEGPIGKDFFQEKLAGRPRARRVLLSCEANAGKLEEPGFFEDYTAITDDAAQWLVAQGLRLIGTDYLSIGPFHHGNPEVHRTLLGNRVVIVEGLDLRAVAEGNHTLVCLPILLPSDGAPCRAVLLPEGALPEPYVD